MHRLLKRQLKRFYKNGDAIPDEMREFVEQVDNAYRQFDDDREMVDRSLRLSSQELMQRNSEMRAVFSTFPDSFVWVDPQGVILDCKGGMDDVINLMSEALKGQGIFDLPMAGDPEAFDAAIERAAVSKEVTYLEYIVTINETEHNYEARFLPLVENVLLVIFRNISKRKRNEEVLIQSEKMLSIGGLAAGMAHEINNPLAAILGNAQLMRKRLGSDMKKNQQVAEECGVDLAGINAYASQRGLNQMLDAIIESGRRAATIVDNTLSFSRKSESEFSRRDLVKLMEKTVELAKSGYDLKKNYDFKQIEVIREYESDLPEIVCEGSKLQQVFFNLLKNGAQAMAEYRARPDVPDAFSVFTIRLGRAGDMVRIEIEDNGPGMDAETRRRVFEPFFTTKGPGSGTGLGMSVSYFIITEDHGGTMQVFSEPGRGSAFVIELPIDGRRE